MLLTSSFDNTIKLWNPKISSKSLWTFEREDYVYDVQWNPANPTLFSGADNEGILSLYDLTDDLEKSIFDYDKTKGAINKMKWSNDGSKLITGDVSGNIQAYNLSKKYLKFDP